jgi:hypothetical protein
MTTRSRLIAMGVFLVLATALIAILLTVDFTGGADATLEPADLPGELFPEAALGVVTGVEVTDHETGQTFAARIGDDGLWQIDALPEGSAPDLPADGDTLTIALIALPGLRPSRVLSSVEALAPFGLDEAHYTVRFQDSTGGTYTFYVGAKSPTSSGYYVRLTEETAAGEVYLVSTYDLDPVLDLAANPPLIQPTPEPTPEPDTGA